MKPNTKFDLLCWLTIGFALSNWVSFTTALINSNSFWYYTPIFTVSLTIFFAIWLMKVHDKTKKLDLEL